MSKTEFAEKIEKTKITAESGKQKLVISRNFDAPRELVFKAYIDPELCIRGLGMWRLKMRLEK